MSCDFCCWAEARHQAHGQLEQRLAEIDAGREGMGMGQESFEMMFCSLSTKKVEQISFCTSRICMVAARFANQNARILMLCGVLTMTLLADDPFPTEAWPNIVRCTRQVRESTVLLDFSLLINYSSYSPLAPALPALPLTNGCFCLDFGSWDSVLCITHGIGKRSVHLPKGQ